MRAWLVVVIGCLVGCGNESSLPVADGGERSTIVDAGPDGVADAAPISTPVRCSEFLDLSGKLPLITFPKDEAPAQYTPNCIAIKVMEGVAWRGDFAAHPIEPSGGDPGNPIPHFSSSGGIDVTFREPGTYGFQCSKHSSVMFGAIKVVP